MTTVTETISDTEAVVWLAFRRDAALTVRVRLPRDKTEAQRVVDAVGCYNQFRPGEVWAIMDGWWEHVTCVELARDRGVHITFTLLPAARRYFTPQASC